MRRLVIDASIAVKWVIEEAGTSEALLLRRRTRLVAPDLLTAECANILWKKVRRDEITADEALVAGRLLVRSGIDLRPMSSLLEATTQLALRLDHAAYDCLYLVLAEREKCPFVTADDRLLRKLAGSVGRWSGVAMSLQEATSER